MERALKENNSRDGANSRHVAQGKAAPNCAQSDLASRINNSPNMIAQRKKLRSLFGGAAQLKEVDEEPIPGAVQKKSDEEAQLKSASTIQRLAKDEDVSQAKFAAESSAQLKNEPAAKPNNTGLPDNLKSGIENLSGMSMDNVKVHYNSSQPAQLNALAYAQGSDIHVAPGQEQHLPHEAWHVVQQAQGRVQPTMQMKDGVPVNDDRGFEREADVMGGKAMQMGGHDDKHVPFVARQCYSALQLLQAPPAGLPVTGTRSDVADGQGRGYSSFITESVSGEFSGTGSIVQADTPGYAWIRHITKTNYWVNFHLVNAGVGGRGVVGNLTPTSKVTNSGSTWRNFEEKCKKEQALRPIHVAVEVDYHDTVIGAIPNTRDAFIHFFPNEIKAELHSYDGTRWNLVGARVNAPINPLLPPADDARQALSTVPNSTLKALLSISGANATFFKTSIGNIKSLENDPIIGGEYPANTPLGFIHYLQAWNEDPDEGNGMFNAIALSVLKENIWSGIWEI